MVVVATDVVVDGWGAEVVDPGAATDVVVVTVTGTEQAASTRLALISATANAPGRYMLMIKTITV